MTRVAVIGLGAMGSRIAHRLLERGHDVVVWNRDPAKTRALDEVGATSATTPADAARAADAVITMVADPQALAAVTEGPDGAVAGAGAATLIQMSTVSLDAVARLASAHATVLDAPVLGSVDEVEAGTLTIFAGGDDVLVERWTPLLAALGRVRHVGGVGAGTAAKLVANASLVGVLTLVGETIALGDALGLERAAIFDVLSATPLAAQAERRRPAVDSGDYPRRFGLALAHKDARLIAEAAAARGVDVRVLDAARRWFADAEASGLGNEDYSAVLARILGERAS